jgi:putative ABC transport system substrate-binding protein
MRRREFLGVLGSAAAAWPVMARAQEVGRVYRLGFMIPGQRDAPAIVEFFDELRLNGFIEGQNLIIIPGGFGLRNDQLDEWATMLMKLAPDVVVGGPEPQLRALQNVTRTIPLVGMTEDMVGAGLAASLSKPGANLTGISILSPELNGKRLDILIEAVPGVRRIAAFTDANNTPQQYLEDLKLAARTRAIELLVFAIRKPDEIMLALDAAKASDAQAVNFLATPLFGGPGNPDARVIFERVAALRLPAIHQWPETAEEGALMAYGPRFTKMFRQRARLVVKVLRGAKPADLPVEQPTNFELVINLKTAKAIGHEIPAGLVLRADKVIE